MSQLNLFPPPYTASNPPNGLFRDLERSSGRSNTAAFDSALDIRDVFLGKRRCVVCGEMNARTLKHCHIVSHRDTGVWDVLKKLRWLPVSAKASPRHECRNGLTLCSNHYIAFDSWQFFIRFDPNTGKYILVHYDCYDESPGLKQFDGKAIGLDPKDKHSPLPLLFLVHEYMVRGRNFYQPTSEVKVTHDWQDWITADDVIIEGEGGSFNFKRSAPPSSDPLILHKFPNLQTSATASPPLSGGIEIAPPDDNLVQQLMVAQRTMPSWKEWQKESMSWEGTAEENIKRYVENIGLESEDLDSQS